MADKINYEELNNVTGGILRNIKNCTPCASCGSTDTKEITKSDGCGSDKKYLHCNDCGYEEPID